MLCFPYNRQIITAGGHHDRRSVYFQLQGRAAHIADLPGRHRPQRRGRVPRERHTLATTGAGARHRNRERFVLAHTAGQHLAGRRHQAERQRDHGVRVPRASRENDALVFRHDRREKHPEQFRAHLRVAGRDAGLWVSAKLRRQQSKDLHHAGGRQGPDERGTDADHGTGDGTNRLAPARHQVPAQRTVPGRCGARQPVDVDAGTSVVRARRRSRTDEVLFERHARV